VLRRPCRPMFILGVRCGCVRDDPVTPSAYDPGRRFSQHTRMSMRHASPCDQSQTAHEYAGNAAAAGVRSERPSCKRTTCTTNPMVCWDWIAVAHPDLLCFVDVCQLPKRALPAWPR
jgi:hypothetical protein